MKTHCHFLQSTPSLILVIALAFFSPSLLAQGLDQKALQEQQRRNRQDQYRSVQNLARTMPKLDVARMSEVFQLRTDGSQLNVEPTLPAELKNRPGQYRLDVEGFPGPTYIQVSRSDVRRIARPRGGNALPAVAEPIQSQTFSLLSYEMPNPDTLTTISVQSYPNYFHVERNMQLQDGHWMVRLMEQRNLGTPEGGSLQLWVNLYGGNVTQPLNVNIQVPDFATLLRDHPKEVEDYVRPLLRQLEQDQLFAPDTHIAWQVLADYWQADERISQQIAAIVPDLGHADFRKRDKALSRLVEFGRDGATVLRLLDRSSFTAEQNLMIDRALAPYAQLPARETAKFASDPAFLLDCLYCQDLPIRQAAIKQLKKVTGVDDLKFNPAANQSDRNVSLRKLRDRLLAKPATRPSGVVDD